MSTLIVTAGNIGSGKTTLAKWIGEHYGMQTYCEVVYKNRYLSDYYTDFEQYAFRLAIHFLSLRSEQLTDAASNRRGSVIDRSIYEDPEVFVRRFRTEGIIDERDYQTYLDTWNLIKPHLSKPDLLIYLTAPTHVLLQRIKKRGRDFEKNIDHEFLDSLQEYYDHWFEKFTDCPVLTIDSTALKYEGGSELDNLQAQLRDYITRSG